MNSLSSVSDAITPLEKQKVMRAVVLYKAEDEKLMAIADEDERLRAAIHVERDIPIPVPGTGEVLVKVMAGALNFNTLWALIFSVPSSLVTSWLRITRIFTVTEVPGTVSTIIS